jgi:small subunit ribosomal protein S20
MLTQPQPADISPPSLSPRASMASHKSAEKRIRQIAKRTAINRTRTSRVRTFVKRVETAIASGDKEAARSAFQLAQPELHRAITKGVLHKNTVSRKLSRLATRINAL